MRLKEYHIKELRQTLQIPNVCKALNKSVPPNEQHNLFTCSITPYVQSTTCFMFEELHFSQNSMSVIPVF